MLLDALHDSPFDHMPHDGPLRQLDSDMARELVVLDPRILLDIEKSEQSLAEILPFPGYEDDVFSRQTESFWQQNSLLTDKIIVY